GEPSQGPQALPVLPALLGGPAAAEGRAAPLRAALPRLPPGRQRFCAVCDLAGRNGEDGRENHRGASLFSPTLVLYVRAPTHVLCLNSFTSNSCPACSRRCSR